LAGGTARGAAENVPTVLVLATEDSQSRLEAEQIAGLRATLPPDTEVVIDCLDVMRMSFHENYVERYEAVMCGKYLRRRPTVVVALNEGALQVFDRYRTNVFKRVPLVVCGKDLEFARQHGGPDGSWTGVFSDPDIEQMIDWALKLHPSGRAVHLLIDYTAAGTRLRSALAEAEDRGRFPVPLLIPGNRQSPLENTWGIPEAMEYVRSLTAEDPVVYAHFLSDLHGGVYMTRRLSRMLARESKAPVFTTEIDMIGDGAIGGNVVDGWRMGVVAGEMAKRILAGEKPGGMPPVILPCEWCFDHRQLKRWGIAADRLPVGSRIVNRPFEFVREYKWWFLGGAVVIVLESLIILQLGISRVLRRRAMRELQESEHRYRSLFETSQDLFLVVDGAGAVLHANSAACRWVGRPLEKLVGSPFADLIALRDRTKVRGRLERALGGVSANFETQLLAGDGQEVEVEFLFHAHDFNRQPAVVCCARPLSERLRVQRLEQEISEREREMLGYEIHDGLGPYATALQIQCLTLKERAERGEPADPESVVKLDRISESLTAEVRSMARSLVPLTMVDRSLESALRELFEIGSRIFHMQAQLEFTLDESRLDVKTAAQLYRIVQEHLRNAIRHAGSRTARIVVRAAPGGGGELIMENDGQPFDKLPTRRAGLGLSIMEQRARLIGSELAIDLTKDGWTRLTCRFALDS